jgi:D-arabinose 1-dehydrogenase-like Zn-dependent alcohol dehydrogenase
MQSQKIIDYGKPLKAVEDPTPTPTGTEILVRIAYCGVCHSDVHIHDGTFHLGKGKDLDIRAGRKLPFILGHEIVGTVAAVGPDVTGVAVGDKRLVYPWIGCGGCAACKRGDETVCTKPRHMGVTIDGGFADHIIVPHGRYLLDYAGIPEERAGPFACSGLTAYGALKKLQPAAADDPIVIIGAGGVGMMGISYAKAMFGRAPLVADIDPVKRAAALAAGAAKVYDPNDPASVKQFLTDTGGGAHGAVDFVGAESSLNFAVACLRRGGKAVVVGLFGGNFEIPIVMFPIRAIAIQGSMVGTLEDMREALDLARAGKVAPVPVELRDLKDAGRSLDDLRGGRIVGRIVLRTN